MEDQARLMAERIARRVASGSASSDVASELAAGRARLHELQTRLVQIEAKVGNVPRVHSPWSHPSMERFGVEEATVSELVDFFQTEKQCSMEPGGKPCDHCAMC